MWRLLNALYRRLSGQKEHRANYTEANGHKEHSTSLLPSERRILVSRLLTHSGDQAWDFAVPLALVSVAGAAIWLVAFYYFLIRLLHVVAVTRVCGAMDKIPRLRAVKIGIGAQTIGVIAGVGGVMAFEGVGLQAGVDWTVRSALVFAVLVGAGVAASLGSAMMAIGVAHDWIPTVVAPGRLATVNSWLKRVDLGTELASPVAAGILLSLQPAAAPHLGLGLIALWNVVSFIPEYRLLRRVHDSESALSRRLAGRVPSASLSLAQRLQAGWRDYWAQPAAMSMLAHALLWLTILSPHGVLLSAWLKSAWQLPDAAIGAFRGLGAVFGLMATVVFPALVQRLGLVGTSRLMIIFEAACLAVAGMAYAQGQAAALLFAGAVLLSRIGLYGFSLGETEIRQRTIPPDVRGRVNGFANALTSLATLVVYGAGAWLGDAAHFGLLVYGSVACVAVSALIFTLNARKLSPLLQRR